MMTKFNVLTLLFVLKFLLIASANYIGDASIESTVNQNVVKRAYYLITTPKVWMSTEESVCLVLLKEYSLPNAVIDVKVQSFSSKEVFIQKHQALNSFSQCIRLPINEIRTERALLRVKLSDIIDETLEIRIKPSNGLTLIETSKPIYRTNEKLQFRVITLNDWLRPIEEQFEQILVENSKSIPVMQWNAIKVTNGIVSLEMPIARDNTFGTWKIKAITKKNVVTEKTFKVTDYDTPNVHISVDSQNYVYLNDTQTVAKVCVRDSFGRLLKGRLNSFVSYFKFSWDKVETLRHITLPYDLKEVELNGCYDLVLQSSQLLWNSRKNSQRSLKLNLQFIEDSSNFVEERSFEIPIVENRLIVSFPSVKMMKQYFKPGLPYFGYALVSHPDYSFASDQQMTVCYQKRVVPWISESGYICQQMVSDSDGLVRFTIPPVDENVKQIEIKVQSLNYPTISSKIVLDPSFSPSHEYMQIRPMINRNYCDDFVEFDLMFNRPWNKQNQKIYYQVIGRGNFYEPQQYVLGPTQKWISSVDRSLIRSQWTDNTDVFVTKLRVKLPQKSALNNNLMNRILLYYLDSNNNLIADSNVFLTTCSDETNHMTQINLKKWTHGDEVDLNLKTYQNSTCAVRVSYNKPYSSLKRINHFIEKFNVQYEPSAKDNCELRYELSKMESGATYSPYTVPYGLDETSSAYEPVLNFGDAWDSFNDIGFLVSSNTKLDESPCEWDLYQGDVLTQLRARKYDQVRNFNSRMNRYVRSEVQDIEKSLFDEIFEWNVVNTGRRPFKQQINNNLVPTYSKLYSDAVCVNPYVGLTYANNVYTRKLNENSFKLFVKAPEVSRLGETLIYKVWIEKSGQQCFPIQLSFETSELYEMVNKPKTICNCGDSSEPISLILIPKQIGSIDVKIVATNPINLSQNDISPDCAQTQSISFTPLSLIKHLTVNPLGIVSKQVHSHVICSDYNNTYDHLSSRDEFHDFSQWRDSSDVIVSNELMEPMLRYIKWRESSGDHNALESLSTFATSFYLYRYSNNVTSHWEYKDEIMLELSKSYQSLMTYRHNDGSYSLLKSRKSSGDIALTASIFRVLAQSKPYLSFIENGNRVNRLRHTLMWILEQQSQDGCFHQTSTERVNVWPLNFENQYELTGYVLTSLLEAGLDLGSAPLAKAYQCLSDNKNVFVSYINKRPLSAVFYTYIQVLNKNVEEMNIWVKELQQLNRLSERNLLDGEVLPYLGLVYYLTNDFNNAKHYGQLLVKRSGLWQTPISSYAITKLWPVLKNRRSSLKVYGNNGEMVSTLSLDETNTHHSLVGPKISAQHNGCLLISSNRIKTKLATTPTNFQVTIDGLNKGFVTCSRRKVKICIKEKVNYSTLYPVVRMQLVSGFDVDSRLMQKMIDSQIVSKYKKLDGEVWLFLHALNSNKDSYCVTVPVVQREELYDTKEAYIRIYDYYNQDISDIIPYKIPHQCQVEQILYKNLIQTPRMVETTV